MSRATVEARGFSIVFEGELYWLDIDPTTGRVTIDLQHHGMMGQPGVVERVGEGAWVNERVTAREGVLSSEGFDAVEAALRESVAEARRQN